MGGRKIVGRELLEQRIAAVGVQIVQMRRAGEQNPQRCGLGGVGEDGLALLKIPVLRVKAAEHL